MADFKIYVLQEVTIKNKIASFAVIGVYGSEDRVKLYCQEMNFFKRRSDGDKLTHYFYTEHLLE